MACVTVPSHLTLTTMAEKREDRQPTTGKQPDSGHEQNSAQQGDRTVDVSQPPGPATIPSEVASTYCNLLLWLDLKIIASYSKARPRTSLLSISSPLVSHTYCSSVRRAVGLK